MNAIKKHCLSQQFPNAIWAINSDGTISWDSTANGRELPEESEYYTEENIATYVEPVVVKNWTCREFLKRFTSDERFAIITASRTNCAVEDLRAMLLASPQIYNNDADLISGMAALVSAGLVSQERSDIILDI